MTKLIEMLRKLEQERFYGSVQIDFQAGDASFIRKTQTYKLDTTRKNDELSHTK